MTEEEFFLKIPEWIRADKKDWNIVTLVAYFCNKYEQKNGVRYKLVRSKLGPTSTKETKDFSKLFSIFAPENYKELSPEEKFPIREEINKKIYNYINWMFDYKFRSGEKSVTGTQLFLMPAMINEFERMYESFLKKNSKKDKMDIFLDKVKKEYPEILDRHQIDEVTDLKILEKYIQNYNLKPESLESIIIKIAKTMEII